MYEILFRRLRPGEGPGIGEAIAEAVFNTAYGRPDVFREDDLALADVAVDSWVDENNVSDELTLEEVAFVAMYARHLAEFAVKHVPTELDLATERERALEAGIYAGGYQRHIADDEPVVPDEYRVHQRDAFVLGFFSAYEIGEIPIDWQDEVERLRHDEEECDGPDEGDAESGPLEIEPCCSKHFPS